MPRKTAMIVKRLDRPDEARAFDKGAFSLVEVGGAPPASALIRGPRPLVTDCLLSCRGGPAPRLLPTIG